VAFGTETVYGLGGDATNGAAVAAIFAAKGRPAFNPLICHYPSGENAFLDAVADTRAMALAEKFWPGPLTLILPRRAESKVHELACAGLATIAVRVPAAGIAHALLAQVDRPIAAPSANISGHVSPSMAAHVMEDLAGKIAAVLDCGPAQVGIESTVLDLSGAVPVLLRPGGVGIAELASVIGDIAMPDADSAVISPGMLASHYAPSLPVRLAAVAVGADEMLLAFGPALNGAAGVFDLSARGDLTEAAQNLFAGLRVLDAEGARIGARGIAVMAVPEDGLGIAINDRLQRAAHPRG